MAKTNKGGRECPSWCTEDHERPDGWNCRGPRHGAGAPHAEALYRDYGPDPEVAVWVRGDTGYWAIYADTQQHGQWLANALEAIAGMRKAEIRALAAGVREAAAEAWPEADAG